jgi:small subunit ribosomal protein S4
MARYTGARLKVLRRYQVDLPGLTRKGGKRKQHPPGQHGPSKRRREGDYMIRLNEKQKVRYNYGINERQMRRYYIRAKRVKHDTGSQMLVFLESRLDNIAFRAGFAATIPAARQLISHGHILVNGRRLNIPSYECKAGDILQLKESSKEMLIIKETMEQPSLERPSYLNVDPAKFTATVTQMPQRDDVPLDIQENFIVEYYARIA